MPRFIVTGRRRGEGRPPVCEYLSKSGFWCYGSKPWRVAVFETLKRAEEERAYFAGVYGSVYDVVVEAIPAGVPLGVAFRRGVVCG